jgi:hypothetical protein
MSKKRKYTCPQDRPRSEAAWRQAYLLASVKGNKDEMDELVRRSQKDDAWKQERLRDNSILYILDAFLP